MVFAAKLFCVRHKIHTAARKRVAAQHTPQREPRAAPRPVNAQRIRRVVRARGIKFAGARHQRGKKRLIYAHQEQQRARGLAHAFALGVEF
jgi:hypothetical protein